MRETLERAKTFLNQSVGSSSFYREEIARVKENLQKAEAALDDYFNATVHAAPSGTSAPVEIQEQADNGSTISEDTENTDTNSDASGTDQ